MVCSSHQEEYKRLKEKYSKKKAVIDDSEEEEEEEEEEAPKQNGIGSKRVSFWISYEIQNYKHWTHAHAWSLLYRTC